MAAMPVQGPDYEDKFVCKVCTKTLSTRTSLSHFTKFHDYDLAVVRKWLLVKDMNCIRNKTCSRAFADGYRACEDWLSEQYIANEAEGIANEAEDGESTTRSTSFVMKLRAARSTIQSTSFVTKLRAARSTIQSSSSGPLMSRSARRR